MKHWFPNRLLITGSGRVFRLRVFSKKVPRRIFRPKRDETGEWRKLHKQELYGSYHSPNIVRLIKSRALRSPGHVESRNAFRVFLGKPIGKRLLGRHRCR